MPTLPVLTKCHYNKIQKRLEMVVVIRDPRNLIQKSFEDDNDVIQISRMKDDEWCFLSEADNCLKFFQVCYVHM